MVENKELNAFFFRDASEVAPEMIGWNFFVNGVGGTIVETEAYNRLDPASHSFTGPSKRNRSMFGPPGCAYVYPIYGLHWCMNFVCSDASAVLLRAIVPIKGIEQMQERRRIKQLTALCSGPAKLTQALGISAALDGVPLSAAPFEFEPRQQVPLISCGARIGISRAVDVEWRFWMSDNACVSRSSARRGNGSKSGQHVSR